MRRSDEIWTEFQHMSSCRSTSGNLFREASLKKKCNFPLKLLDVITCPFTSPKLLILFAEITTIHHVIQTSQSFSCQAVKELGSSFMEEQ